MSQSASQSKKGGKTADSNNARHKGNAAVEFHSKTSRLKKRLKSHNDESEAYTLLNFEKLVPWIAASVFVLFLILVVMVYRSFLVPLFVAAILYILFRNVFYFLQKRFKLKNNVSAMISVTLVLFILVIPLSSVVINLTGEVKYVIDFSKRQLTPENLIEIYKSNEWIGSLTRITENDFSHIPTKMLEVIQNQAPKIFNTEIITQGRLFIADAFRFIFQFILAIIILFFLFRNGDDIKNRIFDNLPLPSDIKKQMGARMTAVFDAVVKGNLLIAAGQGLSIGFYFWVFGLSTPILYGTIGVFFGLIPVLGTNVLWIPGALFLYFQGFTFKAVLFAILSGGTYLTLENVAKPLLLDKELNLHPMILFFAFLGGLAEFGIKGLIIGPFAVTIFLSIWQMVKVWNTQNEKI